MTPPMSDSNVGGGGLPPELLAQLSALPEDAPEDFTCAVCKSEATNRWNHSPRDYERPPICKYCETVVGFAWHGQTRYRTRPLGGTHRDKREVNRIAALADAIQQEAQQQLWRMQNGYS